MQGLNSFDDWKRCITVSCGLPLTVDFVETRLDALRNENDLHTRKFVDMWGDAHLARVIGWFEQAQRELA